MTNAAKEVTKARKRYEMELVSQEPFQDQLKQLDQASFAGKVALNELQLQKLSEIVRKEIYHPRLTRSMMGRLILVAVNCAYYHVENFRFWEPFCQLLGIEGNPAAAAQWLGPKIERALVQFGFLKETRTGPARWVTPIKIEAGITRHDLPSFARILSGLQDQFGWACTPGRCGTRS